MPAPLVSIVTPCFNAAPWIGDTIESVLGQTFRDFELILVDDGSTDGTREVIARFNDPRIRFVQQANAGASAARNLGLQMIRGQFVQFLDADDLLSSNKLEVQLADLGAAGSRWVAATAWTSFQGVPVSAKDRPTPVPRTRSGIDWLVNSWTVGRMMPPLGWLVPRCLVDEVGPWDSACGVNDDGEYFSRILLASDGVVESAGCHVYYRKGIANSFSQRRDQKSHESRIRSYELYAEHVLRVEDSDRTRRAIAMQALSFQYLVYPDFPRLVERARKLVGDLGYQHLRPDGGGRASQLLGRLIGWKLTRRLGALFRRRRHDH